jgi:hypothetical protein
MSETFKVIYVQGFGAMKTDFREAKVRFNLEGSIDSYSFVFILMLIVVFEISLIPLCYFS